MTSTRFETRAGLTELTRIGAEQIRSLPGVLSVSAACCMPLVTVWQLPFVVEGRRRAWRRAHQRGAPVLHTAPASRAARFGIVMGF